MKFVKILLKAVLWIVVVVVVALLVSPLWVGPVGRLVANAVVPGKVQADFHLGHLSANPYTARFELGDMQLANPKGYSEKYAVTVGEIVLDAKTTTLFSDVIHVEEIKVKDVFVSLVSGGQYDVNNFEQIQYNLAGGKEKYEAAKAEEEKAAQEKKPETEAEEKEKKVIIDRLEISGLKIQLGPVPITIPSITLTDIGKESGGSTLEDAWTAILDGIVKAAGALGEQLKAFTGVLGDAAGKAKDAVHAGVKAVGDEHELMMITNAGTIIQLRMDDINVCSRVTSGVKMINVDEGVTVAKIAKVRADSDIVREDAAEEAP